MELDETHETVTYFYRTHRFPAEGHPVFAPPPLLS